jgi:hypothetical protein
MSVALLGSSSPIAAFGVSPSPNWEREGARSLWQWEG